MEDFDEVSTSFISWLHSNNTSISDKIELADLRQHGAGRGVLAKEDIADDVELFTAIKAKLDDPWMGLIAAMVYEHQQGPESKWKPYFDVLPTTFDTLMFWSEEELKWLQGSAVVNKIGKESADAAFKDQILPLVRSHADDFRLASVSDEDVLELCHRMGSTIMAYAFDLEKPSNDEQAQGNEEWEEDDEEILHKGMVPLADMLNADADRNNAKLFYEEDKVIMKSIRAIKSGEEIFNDYGPLPTADVLRRYGYTTPNYAQYDVLEVPLHDIRSAVKSQAKTKEQQIESRLQYLETEDALDDAYDIARSGQEDVPQISDELCVLVNTLTLPQGEFEQFKKRSKLPKPTLSAAAIDVLVSVVQTRQKQYNGPSDDASVMELDGQSSRRKSMAAQVIKGEIQVLQEALDALRTMSSNTANDKRKAMDDSSSTTKKHKR
ncbi:Ribosomal lysine N-methyltransferase 4 [Recurvomyces mirabilis]|nr:Ribosomal lysine N-methyltransferase 4 [Recurvomyces mirabilis]